nr:hypothetical protein [Methanobrevibacter sp. 87.7]
MKSSKHISLYSHFLHLFFSYFIVGVSLFIVIFLIESSILNKLFLRFASITTALLSAKLTYSTNPTYTSVSNSSSIKILLHASSIASLSYTP